MLDDSETSWWLGILWTEGKADLFPVLLLPCRYCGTLLSPSKGDAGPEIWDLQRSPGSPLLALHWLGHQQQHFPSSG